MNKSTQQSIAAWVLALAMATPALNGASSLVNFSDVSLEVPPAQSYTNGGVYYNGSDSAGGFLSSGVHFSNNYNSEWGSWQGWSYSNTSDTTTAGFGNQYSALTGAPFSGSAYGVAYASGGAVITLAEGWHQPLSARITNTTYTGITVQNGDMFAKQFGGAEGNDPDWLLLTITGRDQQGDSVGTVDFYLADYRFTDNAENYIISDWTEVDLQSLGSDVYTLEFAMSSSDVGDFGMNTPAYFAMDDLTVIPEPRYYGLLLGAIALAWIVKRRKC